MRIEIKLIDEKKGQYTKYIVKHTKKKIDVYHNKYFTIQGRVLEVWTGFTSIFKSILGDRLIYKYEGSK